MEKHVYVNPADNEWCKQPKVSEWIIRAWAIQADAQKRSVVSNPAFWNKQLGGTIQAINGENIVSVSQMAAGSKFCASTDPTACVPHPETRVCHGTATLENGHRIDMTFFLNTNTGNLGVETDAQRKAIGY